MGQAFTKLHIVFWEYSAFGMRFDSNLNVSYFLHGRTNQAALLGSPSSHHSQSLTVGPREVKRLCALLTFPTWWRLWQTVLQQALPAPPTVLICQIHLRRRSICPWTRAPALQGCHECDGCQDGIDHAQSCFCTGTLVGVRILPTPTMVFSVMANSTRVVAIFVSWRRLKTKADVGESCWHLPS